MVLPAQGLRWPTATMSMMHARPFAVAKMTVLPKVCVYKTTADPWASPEGCCTRVGVGVKPLHWRAYGACISFGVRISLMAPS